MVILSSHTTETFVGRIILLLVIRLTIAPIIGGIDFDGKGTASFVLGKRKNYNRKRIFPKMNMGFPLATMV